MSEGFTLEEFVESKYYSLGIPGVLRPAHLTLMCKEVRKKCSKEGLILDFNNLQEFKPDYKTWSKFIKIVVKIINV